MSNFTKQQPKGGDVVMHCGHLNQSMHWFEYEKAIGFQRPDGTRGQAAWFAACQACFVRHGDKVTRFVRGDGVWTGDAPVIEKESS